MDCPITTKRKSLKDIEQKKKQPIDPKHMKEMKRKEIECQPPNPLFDFNSY